MKSLTTILLTLTFLMVSLMSFSQDKAEPDNSRTKRDSDIYTYSKDTSKFLILNQLADNMPANNLNKTSTKINLTTVEQIGSNNSVNSFVTSNASQLNYVQIGDNNSIKTSSIIPSTTEQIIQRGSNNKARNFSFGNVENSNFNLIQDGNNQLFEKFGTNKLTENLSFRVQGNSQTIIIRSF